MSEVTTQDRKVQIIGALPQEVHEAIEQNAGTHDHREINKLPVSFLIKCIDKVVEVTDGKEIDSENKMKDRMEKCNEKLIADCKWCKEKLEEIK